MAPQPINGRNPWESTPLLQPEIVSPCTTNEVIRVACEKTSAGLLEKPAEFRHPEFRDLLLRIAGDGGAVSSRRLGKWLSRISGRIVDGYRLVMKTDSSHGNKFFLQVQEADRETVREMVF
jgi:hypothetical protein